MAKTKERAGKKYVAPKIVVCPICGLPARKCIFFMRMHRLKFHDIEYQSARIRSEMFRLYHADHCQKCLLPVQVCKDRTITRIASRCKKDGNYPSGDVVTQMLATKTCGCRKHVINGDPVKPEWYQESEKNGDGEE